MDFIEKLFLAFGLVLAFEGTLYALFSSSLLSMMQYMSTLKPRHIRIAGLIMLGVGVIIVGLVE